MSISRRLNHVVRPSWRESGSRIVALNSARRDHQKKSRIFRLDQPNLTFGIMNFPQISQRTVNELVDFQRIPAVGEVAYQVMRLGVRASGWVSMISPLDENLVNARAVEQYQTHDIPTQCRTPMRPFMFLRGTPFVFILEKHPGPVRTLPCYRSIIRSSSDTWG
jgi:hypothetical protein